MKTFRTFLLLTLLPLAARAQTVVGWNNLGMHCMDADYSVFTILPPYNTIHAQVMDANGLLLTNVTVTYEAIADQTGSINTTSAGKTEFWQFLASIFGLSLPVDVGLPVPGPSSFSMPGTNNIPQSMDYDPTANWFAAYGIPLTPYDDALRKNPYPMMRLVVKAGNTVLAHSDIVLPVSDEMDCRACHASGSGPAAMPAAGWVNLTNDVQRDYRLNILRLHDEKTGTGLFTNTPVLCASCHLSEALPGTGKPGIPALTRSMHDFHAHVIDPTNGKTLEATDNRSACYRCHPGSTTRCLRGAMGSAVAADGTMAMQCQSCHGTMSVVGAATRTGWLEEPNCQSCHAGTTRYTSVFDSPGHVRVPADTTFATNPDAPAPGLSLYRFSKGHGGLYCEACHGSTHAEFPSSHDNDNITAIQHQGHVGVLVECNACHGTQPNTVTGGPHGMHPVGQTWISQHSNVAEGGGGSAQCKACHGADYRGTFLSRMQADRTVSGFGTKFFWRGFQIGCYTCHNGPGSESGNKNHPAVASNASVSTATNTPAAIALSATDADGNALTLRIISQARHGTIGLVGTAATYYPETDYTGNDSFTFAAWDGQTDSNLGKILIGVGAAAPPSDFAGHWTSLAQTCKKKCVLKGRFTVQNASAQGVPASTLAVYLSNDAILDGTDSLLKQYRISAIGASKSITKAIKVVLPAGATASGRYVIALVDADDAMPDADDTNNEIASGPLP